MKNAVRGSKETRFRAVARPIGRPIGRSIGRLIGGLKLVEV